jgi:hypothetical protein
MNWKRCGRKQLWPSLLEGPRKVTKIISQNNRHPSRDSNQAPLKYKSDESLIALDRATTVIANSTVEGS